jgi:hypothetical protein
MNPVMRRKQVYKITYPNGKIYASRHLKSPPGVNS